MAKELVQFSWTISTVVDERLACLTAVLILLAATTVSTLRMLVSYVHLYSFLDQVCYSLTKSTSGYNACIERLQMLFVSLVM